MTALQKSLSANLFPSQSTTNRFGFMYSAGGRAHTRARVGKKKATQFKRTGTAEAERSELILIVPDTDGDGS